MLPTEEETHVCTDCPKLLGPNNENESNVKADVNVNANVNVDKKMEKKKAILNKKSGACK